ncbi:Alpha-galactosidase OS=Streptomyces violarus OX=67380 GN=FHS41_000994 PE=3 SV=1 [Streptomyces violarus]
MLDISEDGRTWVLSGPASSYAVHVTDRDELLHLHWGPRIGLADAEALAVRPLPDYWPFESPLDGREEYPVEGGPRFARPARPSAPRSGAAPSGPTRGMTPGTASCWLRIRDGDLTIRLHYRMRSSADVVERWVTLDNRWLSRPRADSGT